MKSILIVDDELAYCQLAACMFMHMSYDAIYHHDPVQALAIHRRKPFQLCLIDVNMPDMHGTEVAQRAIEIFPDGEVVLFSSFVGTTAVIPDTLRAVGIKGVIDKPYRMEDFISIVNRYFGNERRDKQHLRTLMERSKSVNLITLAASVV